MFPQYWDISSPVNADYAKQGATLPGTPRFNFTLTIKVSARRVFYDHAESEKMRHYGEVRWVGRGWGGDKGGKNMIEENLNKGKR